MKKGTKDLIKRYQFEDDKNSIRSVIIGNLALGFLLLLAMTPAFYLSPRVLICFMTGLLYLYFLRFYTWDNHFINLVLPFLYFSIFLVELLTIGMPSALIKFDSNGLSKGILFEMMIGILPLLYTALRAMLIIPLVKIIYSSKQV